MHQCPMVLLELDYNAIIFIAFVLPIQYTHTEQY